VEIKYRLQDRKGTKGGHSHKNKRRSTILAPETNPKKQLTIPALSLTIRRIVRPEPCFGMRLSLAKLT
jgi:hypothetical protein